MRRSSWVRAAVAAGLIASVVAIGPGSPAGGTERTTGAEAVERRSAAQATEYTNPVANGRLANPTVLKVGSTYYAYTSGFDYFAPFRIRVMSSTDLATWTGVGSAFPAGAAGSWVDDSSGWNFTSPSVAHFPANPAGEQYVLYFSALHATSGETCIGVATSGAPEGPFTGAGAPLICPPGGAQDPSLIAQTAGTVIPQLVYRRNGATPAIYNQVLSADGQSLASGLPDPYLLYEAQPTWWHQGVVERPTVTLGSDGGIYLFLAGGPAGTEERAIGWSPCREGWGVVSTCANQTVLGSWMAGDDQVAAPSGPQVVVDGDHQWIVYDGRPASSCSGGTCTGTPEMRLDKLCFAHGFPRTNGPSTGPQTLARTTDCSADVPGATLDPQAPTDDGTVAPLPRDGNVSGAAGGRALWVFGDTFDCAPLDNSGAYGVPHPGATGPHWMADPGGGCPTEAVPKTAAEHAFDAIDPDQRIVHWPSGVIGLPDGSAIMFYGQTINSRVDGSWWNYDTVGIGAARLSAADVAAGVPTVNRAPAVSPGACNPPSGAVTTGEGCLFDATVDPGSSDEFRHPLVDDGYLYMYSPNKLARAPLDDFEDPSAWEYWTGQSPPADWSPYYADAAVIPNRDQPWGNGGQVSYNPYLDRFVNYQRIFADLFISTAEEPTGPWTPLEPLHATSDHICNQSGGVGAWTRTPYVHDALFTEGGRTVALTYYRPGDSSVPGCTDQLRWATVELD